MMDKKYALVTGGSEGVGFAVAEMLVRNGFFVFLVARSLEKLETARLKLGGEQHAAIFSCDVTNREALQQICVEICLITDHFDVLVNSAGTFKWDGSGVNLDLLNAKSKEFSLEVFGPLLCAGALVVNVSSQAALFSDDDLRREGEHEYVDSMRHVDELSHMFAAARPDVRVHVSHPPLMRGKIAETEFRGRAGFEGIDFDALPGPEIVAQEVEEIL